MTYSSNRYANRQRCESWKLLRAASGDNYRGAQQGLVGKRGQVGAGGTPAVQLVRRELGVCSVSGPLNWFGSAYGGGRPRAEQVAVGQGKPEDVQRQGHGHGSQMPGIRVAHGDVDAQSRREAD